MPIYTTPLSQLGPPDLQELLDGNAVENVRLEFKLIIPGKEDTLKKLSSFANTFGGFMVIGAKANSADGRIEDLPGVDEEANYKQKIVQWCFDGASPPLTVEVSDPIPTPSGNGKVCYVISVAESDVAPHFLNGRKGVWVRADEFSAHFEARLADEGELRHLFDRRKLVLQRRELLLGRAQKRFDTFAARSHTDRGGNRTSIGSLLELCIVPRFPARQLCRQEELKSLVQRSWTSWRSVTFPDPGSSILSQHESAIVLAAASDLSFFEVNAWGMLFYAARIESDHYGTKGIHVGQFVGYLLLFVRHAGKLLRSMGSGGPIHIETTIDSLLGAQWLNPQQGWFVFHPGSELDDDVTFSISTTSEELNANPDGVVVDLLRNVFFAVNWAAMVETAQGLEGLIRLGYTVNSWNQPMGLKI
jgi:Putative DNA-binding domain